MDMCPGVNISQNSWINHPGKVSLFGLVQEEFLISMINAFCRDLHVEQKMCLKQKLSAVYKCFLTFPTGMITDSLWKRKTYPCRIWKPFPVSLREGKRKPFPVGRKKLPNGKENISQWEKKDSPTRMGNVST